MKIFKILASTIAVLVLVAAAGVAWLVASFDAARIKQEIATVVATQTGRTLTIAGDLSLGFWPDVAIRIGRTTLSERGSTQTFATLDNARVVVAVWPLLSKRVVVKQIELTGLKAGVIKRKDGTLNIADLAGDGKDQERKVGAGETALPAAPLALPTIDIAAIRLADVELTWHDEISGQRSRVAANLGLERIVGHAGSLKMGKLTGSLDIDRLDIDRYLWPQQPDGKAGGASAPGSEAEGKIDLAALKDLNLEGSIKIGQLKAAGLEASEIRLQLAASDGQLRVAPLAAQLYAGRLDGTLSVDADGNRFALRQTLTNVQIGPLLADLMHKDMLTGRGNIALDVTTQGASVAALQNALAGTAHITLADGAIKGINLGQRLREAQALLRGKSAGSFANDASQKTDFSELSASFRIANGVAHNDDLMARSPLLRLAGAGDIDIGNSRLDYLLQTSIVATATGQGGKDLASVRSITLPVRLTGPFDHPSWKLELAGIAEAATKAKIAEKKAEIRQKAESRLQDKLRGFLGR